MTSGRDRDVRNAIQAALLATGQFDGVWLSGLPEDYGQAADDLAAAVIEPASSTEVDYWDSEPSGGIIIQSVVTLTLLVRNPDPQLRDEAVELLVDYAADAINGQNLAGITVCGRTKITSWRWQPPAPPERRVAATVQYEYIVEGWDELDETP
jgi:hypothetical protein